MLQTALWRYGVIEETSVRSLSLCQAYETKELAAKTFYLNELQGYKKNFRFHRGDDSNLKNPIVTYLMP